MPISPQAAGGLPVVDISDLLNAAIPAEGFEKAGWDYMADSPIIRWRTDGVNETGTSPYREGWVRVRVRGRPSTVLHQQREELAWTLTLGSDAQAKFGPKWIRIEIGTQPNNQCFGTMYDGCTFAPADALASPNLQQRHICEAGDFGDTRSIYEVNAPGKLPVLLVYEQSGGSGGAQASLELRPLEESSRICKAASSH